MRYEELIRQSDRSVSWAEVGQRKQNQRKRCKASLEKQVHGSTTYNELSMWVPYSDLVGRCAGWASENMSGKRLRDVRKPRDARLSYEFCRLMAR